MSTPPVAPPSRPIFRPAAVEQHARARNRQVLPWFLAPPTFACCWLLLGLVAAGSATAWSTRVPVYATAPAIILADAGGGNDRLTLLLVLSPEDVRKVRVGAEVSVDLAGQAQTLKGAVDAVEDEPRSPTAIRQRFELDAGAAAWITHPGSVVLAHLDPATTGGNVAAWAGSTGQGLVEVGAIRVAALLPLVSAAFSA